MQRQRHILLIEDNEQNRYLATYLLGLRGHRITPAITGPAGIKLAREETPDLVLLDIQLPAMDGYSVARALRAIAATRGAAFYGGEIAEEGLSRGTRSPQGSAHRRRRRHAGDLLGELGMGGDGV